MVSERIIRASPWLRTLGISAWLCVPRIGHAADIAPALDYSVEEGCPARDAFLDLVQEKLAGSGAEGRLETPRVTVSVLAAGSTFVGRLALQRADGSSYDREVSGASCAEVASALAFVLALALGAEDPAATTVAAPATPKPPEAEQPPKPSTPPPVTSVPPVNRSAPAPEPRPSGWRLGFGVQGGERAGLSPLPLLFGSVFVQAQRRSAPLSGASWRAGFSLAPSASSSDENGTTDFSWWAYALEACPVRARLFGRLEARPCAALDVGRLHVHGVPLSAPGSSAQSASRVWVDVMTGVRLELPFGGVFSAELQGNLILPLTHYKISFDPGAMVYEVPGLAAGGLIGLSARFP